MRVDVKKYLFFGPVTQKALFFQKAQEYGCIEFIDHRESVHPLPIEGQKLQEALKILKSVDMEEQNERSSFTQTPDALVHEILSLSTQLHAAQEEWKLMVEEKKQIIPFGHIDLEEIKAMEKKTNRKWRFWKGSSGVLTAPVEELLYVTTSNKIDYYISFTASSLSIAGLTEIIFQHSLKEIDQRISQLQEKIQEYRRQLRSYRQNQEVLEQAFIDCLNQYHLLSTEEYVEYALDGLVFGVEGWVPVDRQKELQWLQKEFLVLIEPVEQKEEELLPTYLENTGAAKVGEDLVNIYDTPSAKDKDPSLWVLFSFALFFAMIVADAGYGLIFFISSLFLWKKTYKKRAGVFKRFSYLVMSLGCACMLSGLLTSSFFAIQIPPNSVLRTFSLTTYLAEKKAEYQLTNRDVSYKEIIEQYPAVEKATTVKEYLYGATALIDGEKQYVVFQQFCNNILLELAVFVGSIHIICSLARYLRRNWSALGWIFFIIGGYLYCPSIVKATSFVQFVFGLSKQTAYSLGGELAIGGICLAFITALIQRKWLGLTEVVMIIQIFSDILSYLRLYALALAGAMMGETFNSLGSSAGIFFGTFIILIGHLINLALGIMGGVVHGLRLNFLEWYHYSFEGGGRFFKPLQLLKVKETS